MLKIQSSKLKAQDRPPNQTIGLSVESKGKALGTQRFGLGVSLELWHLRFELHFEVNKSDFRFAPRCTRGQGWRGQGNLSVTRAKPRRKFLQFRAGCSKIEP